MKNLTIDPLKVQQRCEEFATRHIAVLLEELDDMGENGFLCDGAVRELAALHEHVDGQAGRLQRAKDLIARVSMKLLREQFKSTRCASGSRSKRLARMTAFDRFYEVLAVQCTAPPPLDMAREWWAKGDDQLQQWVQNYQRFDWMEAIEILDLAQVAAERVRWSTLSDHDAERCSAFSHRDSVEDKLPEPEAPAPKVIGGDW